MKFAASQWLWALLLIPVFYGILRGDESRKKKRFEQFAHPKLWSFLVPEMNPALRTRKVIFGLLAFGFAIFALARPQYGFHQESVKLTGLDVMVVLDVSRSMDVEDVVPSRLKKAKHLIKKILDRLDGDRVGLVGFAGSSFLACPLTTDLAYVWDRVEILTPQSVTPQGTDLGAGLSAAIGALERGAEQGKGATAEAKTSRVLLLLSDGEDHQGRLREWADQLKDSGISLFVVGVGTDAGAPIPIQDENGNRVGYKKDRNSQPVMSQFHPEALRDLAQRVGGRYWTITPQESEAEEILHELSGLVRGEFSERKIAVYEERFQIPLFFAVLFLLLELCVPARKLLVWVAVFFHGLSSLQAAEMKPLPVSLDSYLSNQKGIDAFEKGELEEARRLFGSAQARDPLSPELEFNQGLVHLSQENFQAAADAFERSAALAQQKNQPELVGRSLYNLGKAFEKAGDLKNSVSSYAQAIQKGIETQDLQLEQDARKNLELLLDQKKKQKEEKKQKSDSNQKQDQKNQQNSNSQDQKDTSQTKNSNSSSDDSSSQGDQEKKKNQDADSSGKNPNESTSPPKENESKPQQERPSSFQSKKMTQEDAERVLSELKNKEKKLQERMQNKNAKHEPSAKDW